MMPFVSWLRRLPRSLRAFVRTESGMTLPLLGVSMVVLTGMIGLALDVARLQMMQAKLQFSLDAAGLAAGSTAATSNVSAEVSKYLTTNFNGYMGATITSTSATVSTDNSVITLAAAASMPTTFLKTVGISVMTANAHSEITRNASGLELVLVLDNTGSMADSAGGGVSKISALQTASQTLINTLFGSGTTPVNLWVGVVPFSQAVNIGASHTDWVDSAYTGLDWGNTSWAGCVDARVVEEPPVQYVTGNVNTIDEDITETTPDVVPFTAYYWPDDANNNWQTCTQKYNKCSPQYNRCKKSNGSCTQVSPTCTPGTKYTCTQIADKCTTSTTCTPSATVTCTGFSSCSYSSPAGSLTQGPNKNCPAEVTRMTSNKASLLAAVSNMTPAGNTHVDLGLAWGWRMLSQNWRGKWGGTMGSTLPKDYNTPHMAKAIVLLTDGDNTVSSNVRTAYDYPSAGMLGTTNTSTAQDQLDLRTAQLCQSIKEKNVYIYTIALGADLNSGSLSMLKKCATTDTYAFVSPSTSQLQGIFSTIGDSLSNLRVSK